MKWSGKWTTNFLIDAKNFNVKSTIPSKRDHHKLNTEHIWRYKLKTIAFRCNNVLSQTYNASDFLAGSSWNNVVYKTLIVCIISWTKQPTNTLPKYDVLSGIVMFARILFKADFLTNITMYNNVIMEEKIIHWHGCFSS